MKVQNILPIFRLYYLFQGGKQTKISIEIAIHDCVRALLKLNLVVNLFLSAASIDFFYMIIFVLKYDRPQSNTSAHSLTLFWCVKRKWSLEIQCRILFAQDGCCQSPEMWFEFPSRVVTLPSFRVFLLTE